MKTAISVPDDIFVRVDRFARKQRLSRSAVFTAAASEYIRNHRADDVTQQLNAVYEAENSSLDPIIESIQTISISDEEW